MKGRGTFGNEASSDRRRRRNRQLRRRQPARTGPCLDVAANGRDGLFLAAGETCDVIIVDRMLPGLDGLAIVKTIRAAGIRTPVLFLTTMGGINDRVEGLDSGGDDYLVKPFAISELTARVNALARRPALAAETTVLRVADLEMNLLQRTVSRARRPIELQQQEFRILEYLMRNAERVVTRTMLLEGCGTIISIPGPSGRNQHQSSQGEGG